MTPPAVAILTVSDRRSAGALPDTAGPAVAALVARADLGVVAATALVPDDADAIEAALRRLLADGAHLVLTVGGTGLAPRDVTPEATSRVVDRPCPGLLELARTRCGASFPRAYLSRGVAGAAGPALVVNLPGSERGATGTLAALLDVLPHAVALVRGGDADAHDAPTGPARTA